MLFHIVSSMIPIKSTPEPTIPNINDMAAYEFSDHGDKDPDLDLADLSILTDRWMLSDCSSCDNADLTGKGNVNLDSLDKFICYWFTDVD